jgi:hypothetical protein
VIGRDHLDSGSVASPNRETEGMRDGTDAVSDWPLLNALLNTASGATWVSFHHGGGVGMGYSQHAGVVIVCDGSESADKRLARVLFNDPASGVMRHADAGYNAIACAKEKGVRIRGSLCASPALSPPRGEGVMSEPDERARGEWDTLWTNVHLATMAEATGYGAIRDGAIAARDGRIAWLGRAADLPDGWTASCVEDGGGCWVTPGLIDCHTHIVYAGDRSAEVEDRLNGVTYEEIARRGGGIVSTVRATRAAAPDDLVAVSVPRVASLLAEGVTTIEIKSGYGLELATEAKMLRAARAIGARLPVRVKTTFLGAHALPPEFSGRADAYIDAVCGEMLPALAAQGSSTRSTPSAKRSASLRRRPSGSWSPRARWACR